MVTRAVIFKLWMDMHVRGGRIEITDEYKAGVEILLSQWAEQPDVRQHRQTDRQRTDGEKCDRSDVESNREKIDRERDLKCPSDRKSKAHRDRNGWNKRDKQMIEKKERGRERERETSFKQTTTPPKRQYMSFLSVVSVFVSFK